ncbi:hypothetical protein CRENBAI_011118 [Crenichthys baileyi]|uniref:Uncharacterized protein n=1 Tax=Crenichthys baileyi TaxID=28760 RepID=A0AAV9SKR6_9TELE
MMSEPEEHVDGRAEEWLSISDRVALLGIHVSSCVWSGLAGGGSGGANTATLQHLGQYLTAHSAAAIVCRAAASIIIFIIMDCAVHMRPNVHQSDPSSCSAALGCSCRLKRAAFVCEAPTH